MGTVDRLYYALNRIEDKSVATMGYADWHRLVRPDGKITELEQLPAAINNPLLAATTITAVASGIAVALRWSPSVGQRIEEIKLG